MSMSEPQYYGVNYFYHIDGTHIRKGILRGAVYAYAYAYTGGKIIYFII